MGTAYPLWWSAINATLSAVLAHVLICATAPSSGAPQMGIPSTRFTAPPLIPWQLGDCRVPHPPNFPSFLPTNAAPAAPSFAQFASRTNLRDRTEQANSSSSFDPYGNAPT